MVAAAVAAIAAAAVVAVVMAAVAVVAAMIAVIIAAAKCHIFQHFRPFLYNSGSVFGSIVTSVRLVII